MDTFKTKKGEIDRLIKNYGSEKKKILDDLKEAMKDNKSALEMTLPQDELEKKGKDALQERTTCVSVKEIWSYSGY